MLQPDAAAMDGHAQLPISISIAADSVTLSFPFGNGLFIQQVLTVQTMNDLCKAWLESRKQLLQQQRLVADVLKTKK